MRKTVRATLPCPHCGQMIRFNQRNPAYSKKQEIENIRKGIQSLQEYLERLEN